MARKKKTKKVEQPKEPEQVNVVATNNQAVGYQGKVTVKIAHGNKIIETRTSHNNGTRQLFKFLCNAIAGQYSESLRPCKIKLFNYPAAEADQTNVPTNFKWEEAFSLNNKPISITPFVLYDTTPKVVVYNATATEPEHASVTLHFRVPFSIISDDTLYMIAIYPNGTYASAEGDAAAYYLFTDDTGTKWKPENFTNISGNFSLIIEWEMSIMNKQTTTTASTNN